MKEFTSQGKHKEAMERANNSENPDNLGTAVSYHYYENRIPTRQEAIQKLDEEAKRRNSEKV